MENFTESSKAALRAAHEYSKTTGASYVGSEHLLLGILCDSTSSAGAVLASEGITLSRVLEKVSNFENAGLGMEPTVGDITPALKSIIESSALNSASRGHDLIGTEHLLYSMLEKTECVGTKLIISLGGYVSVIKNKLFENDAIIPLATEPEKDPVVKKYTKDLTEKAMKDILDPVIGREEETARVVGILCRRFKNNPCLVGEPGVGKTAVVEGLARLIVEKKVPEELIGKRVLALDLSLMIAGAKYRGEFEERLKKIIKEAEKNKKIILFIDEIHTIIGAGSAEGAMDAANILKPALARGEIQVIGATTLEEYTRHIEKDSALERRFGRVFISEPTPEKTVEILRGLRERYEKYHKIKISDEALKAAVELSVRYINGKFLPDKAIDLLDEASATLKLDENKKDATLGTDDILKAVGRITGVPVSSSEKTDRIEGLEEKLKSRVIGQDDVIHRVCKAIKRGAAGINDPSRPLASFLFTGPTGVGKTELAIAISEELFGEGNIIRLDMSEYAEKGSIAKLLGASPGYVGYSESGKFCKAVKDHPHSLILFDEIEKADREIYNLFLQILDEGRLTPSAGSTVSFKNCIIIMTSNAHTRGSSKKSIGFNIPGAEIQEKDEAISALSEQFGVEFINRIDEVLTFKNLSFADCEQIISKLANEFKKRVEKNLGIVLCIDDEALRKISYLGFSEKFGARNLKRTFRELVEDKISDEIIKGNAKRGSKVTFYLENNELGWKITP